MADPFQDLFPKRPPVPLGRRGEQLGFPLNTQDPFGGPLTYGIGVRPEDITDPRVSRLRPESFYMPMLFQDPSIINQLLATPTPAPTPEVAAPTIPEEGAGTATEVGGGPDPIGALIDYLLSITPETSPLLAGLGSVQEELQPLAQLVEEKTGAQVPIPTPAAPPVETPLPIEAPVEMEASGPHPELPVDEVVASSPLPEAVPPPVEEVVAGAPHPEVTPPPVPTADKTRDILGALFRGEKVYDENGKVVADFTVVRPELRKKLQEAIRLETRQEEKQSPSQQKESPKRTYTVQPGDYLRSIAQRYYGDEMMWPLIVAMNPQITRPDLIHPGTTLNIP